MGEMTATGPDNAREPDPERPARGGWWPPLSVITGTLVGCALPAFAYAEALASLRGFGAFDRRWAAIPLIAPSVVWLVKFGPLAVVLLAPQLLIAAFVSGLIARVRRRR